MSTDAKVFYYEGAYAATDTTIRSYSSEKATDPLLQIVTITAGTRKAPSPEELEEREWMSIVSKPRVIQRLRELGRQALEEDMVGETEEGGFDCL